MRLQDGRRHQPTARDQPRTGPARTALRSLQAKLAATEQALGATLASMPHSADEIEEADIELRSHRAKMAANELDPAATRVLPRLGRRSLQMVLRLLAYNAELWLSERLNAYLADPDKVRAITRHLLHQPGTITYRPGALTVTIDRPDQPRIARALHQLTDELNATPAHIPGDTRPITYQISP